MFALIIDNKLEKFPANPEFENPHVSFPANWGGGVIEEKNYVKVFDTDTPLNDEKYNIDFRVVYNEENERWEKIWTKKLKDLNSLKNIIFNYYDRHVSKSILYKNYNIFFHDYNFYLIYSIKAKLEQFTVTKRIDRDLVDFTGDDFIAIVNLFDERTKKCNDTEKKFLDIITSGNEDLIVSTDFSIGWPE